MPSLEQSCARGDGHGGSPGEAERCRRGSTASLNCPSELGSGRGATGPLGGRGLTTETFGWHLSGEGDTAEKLRAGDRDPPFPPECFPPAMPFVGA